MPVRLDHMPHKKTGPRDILGQFRDVGRSQINDQWLRRSDKADAKGCHHAAFRIVRW